MSFVAAAIGAVVTVGATAISANQQKQARKGASQKAASLQRDIELLEQERNRTIPIIDPYAGVNDLSFMIENFSEEFCKFRSSYSSCRNTNATNRSSVS